MVESIHDVKATVMGHSLRFTAEIDFNGNAFAERWLEKQDITQIHQEIANDEDRLVRSSLNMANIFAKRLEN